MQKLHTDIHCSHRYQRHRKTKSFKNIQLILDQNSDYHAFQLQQLYRYFNPTYESNLKTLIE